MAWASRQYPIREVNLAGRALGNPKTSVEELDRALTIINNWRSSHSYPLNVFQNTLRDKAEMVDASRLIAQRIKRISSIKLKLSQPQHRTMSLTQMQDIGGCRAIVESVRQVEELVVLYKKSDLKHKLVHEDNYIGNPRASGYRGAHLVYRYFSSRNDTWNGLKIEMQFRSKLQHAWATAVETVGTFKQQALKSSLGEEEWLRFFSLMGSAHALKEGTAFVPDTPTGEKQLIEELREISHKLQVESCLETYGTALRFDEHPNLKKATYFLMKLEPALNRVHVSGYKTSQLEEATEQYLATERTIEENSDAQAVLVSVDSLKALKRAYPNYFLDTRIFIESLKRSISNGR